MSRTLHMDLTPSRRSKRLLKNGYYQPPPGEMSQRTDSSEEDDDNASVHSDTSSIYSQRAIHYNESPVPQSHKRRRRKGVDSPRGGGTVTHAVSPIIKYSTPRQRAVKQFVQADQMAKNTSQRSTYSMQEASTSSTMGHVRNETKTTITAVRSVSQRYARGESSSLTRMSQRTQLQAGGIGDHTTSYDHLGNQQGMTTRHQVQGGFVEENHVQRGGDAALSQGLSKLARYTDASESQYTSDNSHAETESTHTKSSEMKTVQYSSAESDFEEHESIKEQYEPEAIVSIYFSKVSDMVLNTVAFFVDCFAAFCQTVYQAILVMFVFDVWWLSLRTNPLFAKIVRGLLFAVLILLLLFGSSYVTNRFYGEETSMLLLPVQSIGGAFHMLSQKIRSFSAPSPPEEDAVLQMETIAKMQRDQAAYPATYPELEEALSRMELQFADKLVEVKKIIESVRKQQFDYNKRQMEDFRAALLDLEHKMQKEILTQISISDDRMVEKLLAIKTEIALIRSNRTQSGDEVKAEIGQLRALLSDRSQASNKITEYNTKLAAFDARLTTLNNLMVKSMKDFDKHIGNTTYLKEIAKMQFIESFLHLMKTDPKAKSNEGESKLNFLFLAWLKKEGFAHVEEIDRSVADMAKKTNRSIEALEKKFTLHLEKVRKSVQRQASSLTLERIMDRPLRTTPLSDSDMENQIKQWIQNELETYSADRIALSDHALESAGGYIVSTRCSESYNRKTALVSLFGIPIYYNINTPRSAIQPSSLPGECWSFKGSEGYLVIALSGSVLPTSFTVEHIPRELSPYGRIDSAPKDFTVFGLHDSYDYEGVPLGEFRYEEDGPVIQQFAALAQPDYFSHVELRIRSNWGHKEYTCLYRFRVHGTRREAGIPVV